MHAYNKMEIVPNHVCGANSLVNPLRIAAIHQTGRVSGANNPQPRTKQPPARYQKKKRTSKSPNISTKLLHSVDGIEFGILESRPSASIRELQILEYGVDVY